MHMYVYIHIYIYIYTPFRITTWGGGEHDQTTYRCASVMDWDFTLSERGNPGTSQILQSLRVPPCNPRGSLLRAPGTHRPTPLFLTERVEAKPFRLQQFTDVYHQHSQNML